MIGLFLGSLFGGYINDTFGRKKVFSLNPLKIYYDALLNVLGNTHNISTRKFSAMPKYFFILKKLRLKISRRCTEPL